MKPMKSYSHIRGFCHHVDTDLERLRRELGWARDLKLNSTRVWLSFERYEADPEGYLEGLRRFIRTAWEMGISTMPILFNGNMLDPETIRPAFYQRGDAYAGAVVEALKDEPGLIMWDIMNEPTANDYFGKASPEVREARLSEIWAFLRHYCGFVKGIDPENAVTIGHDNVFEVEPTADCVDVLSFHDYKETLAKVEAGYVYMERLSARYNKPFINSELCCLCRSNPYDMALKKAREHETGWYLFNLMIGEGVWGAVHGIFYPDGTLRDPSILAAVLGYYRNRDPKTVVAAQPNQEGFVEKALREANRVLQIERSDPFGAHSYTAEEILEAAENCANILECCQLVPMNVPPTVAINRFRSEKNPNLDEIKAFTYQLAKTLKKASMLVL